MKTRTTITALGSLLAAGGLLLPHGAGQATAAPVTADDRTVSDHTDGPDHTAVADQAVSAQHDRDLIAFMARTSGRTFAAQKAQLQRQDRSNNIAARLQGAGHRFDGLFLDRRGDLVVQAEPGSPAARAAAAAGATVREPAYGEQALTAIQDELSRQPLQGVASIGVDLERDRVVITRHADLAPSLVRAARAHGAAVAIREGEANERNVDLRGGDKIRIEGGGYCSAGFPGTTSDDVPVMVWVGHCVEGADSFYDASSTHIGTHGDGDFFSYDGRDDYDTGYVVLDDEDSLSVTANDYGTGWDLDASRGAYSPATGSEICRTGATTGVTCGKITSYGNTVSYVDEDDHDVVVAVVRGLARTTACTEGGDSGGAYSSGGYGVGLTSGGPVDGECGWNGGFVSGTYSYMQPVTDVLDRYDLTYG